VHLYPPYKSGSAAIYALWIHSLHWSRNSLGEALTGLCFNQLWSLVCD